MSQIFVVNTFENIDEQTLTHEQIQELLTNRNIIKDNISEILKKSNDEKSLLKYLLESKSEKIIDIDTSLFYYSSVKKYEDYKKDFFLQKKWCWMSHRFDQALLHLFDAVRLYQCNDTIKIWPLISRFKVKPCKIIKSEKNNFNIFDGILEKTVIDKIRVLVPHFEIDNNKFILDIIEILNIYLPEDNRIYGYTNYDDQVETALINFNNLIISDSYTISHIKKYKVGSTDDEYIFPMLKNQYYKLYEGRKAFYDELNGKRRMLLNEDAKIEIEYENFDNLSLVEIYKTDTIENYFKNKYLKYKSKYLKYKKDIAQ
jgi:hypothetical protein